jgi:hypothetical protein
MDSARSSQLSMKWLSQVLTSTSAVCSTGSCMSTVRRTKFLPPGQTLGGAVLEILHGQLQRTHGCLRVTVGLIPGSYEIAKTKTKTAKKRSRSRGRHRGVQGRANAVLDAHIQSLGLQTVPEYQRWCRGRAVSCAAGRRSRSSRAPVCSLAAHLRLGESIPHERTNRRSILGTL